MMIHAARPSLLALYNSRKGVLVDRKVWLFAGIYYSVNIDAKVAPIKPLKDQDAARVLYADKSKSRKLVGFRPCDFARIKVAHNL